MKKLITYLKALWSRVADSQSTDVSLDCRLTVGSPSGFGSKSLLKFVSVLALIFTLGIGNVWADYASNFTDKNLSVGTGELTWSASPAFNSYESSGSARGAQSTKATSTITITSANISGTITQIDVVGSMNGGGSMSVTVGGSSFGSSETINKGDSKKTYTFSGSATVTNKAVVITVTRSVSATFWIKSVAITTASGASVATPTFSVAEGTYNSNQSVTISCATAGSTIYYTTNGTTPTSSSTAYSSAVSISSTTTLKAIAIKSGTSSSVASATYTLKCATPTFSPAAGTYGAVQSVSISTTYGTNIYYTTDGSTPTTSSTLYSSAISVSSSQTIKAIATKTGCSNSEVSSAEYTINIPYTVSFNTGTGNPTVSSRTEASAGAGITLPSGPTPACSGDGWSFAGWGYESCDDESTEPTLYIAGNKYYPSSNETLYAVYVKGKTASTNYKLISDAAQIVSGENYVIAAYYNSNDYAITAAIQSSYYIQQTAVTVNASNIIANPGATIIWQLTKETGSNVSLYNSNQSKYLYVYASGSYRNLGLYASKKQFTMTEEREAGYASTFAFKSTDYTSYYINYDASHTDFGTKTSSDENLYLYKRQYTGTYESNPTCKDVKSIAVQTAPTTLTYCAGDMFDPTGLVIRVTYTDDSYENVTYSGHESDFSFTPSTSTALTTGNTSVTITYRSDKKTTQAITVNTAYTITLTGSGTVTGGTISADNSSACAGSIITLTATPNTHYTFSSWNVTSGGSPVTVTSNQFTMPSGDVTVNATFTEDAYRTVVFKSNKQVLFDDGGSATTFDGTNKWKQKVYLTEKPVWPTDLVAGQACDANSTDFKGWVADGQTWTGKEASVPVGSTLITSASGFAAAASGSGDVVYHAVWAKGTSSVVEQTASFGFEEASPSAWTITNINQYSDYYATGAYSGKPGDNGSGTILSPVTIQYKTKLSTPISISFKSSKSNKKSNDSNWHVQSSSDGSSWSTVTDGTGPTNSELSQGVFSDPFEVDLSSLSNVYIRIEHGGTSPASLLDDIVLTYEAGGTTYSDYLTTCCDELVTLSTNSPSHGSITFSPDGTIATCGADAATRQTTMTVTPDAGYYLSAWSTTGVTPYSVNPSIAYGSVSNSGAQATTVTFNQNTTTGTYTANATFTAIPVSSLSLRAQQTGQSDKVGNDLTMNCYPKEGQTGGNDPLNHTLKVLFEEVLPANALDKTYDWSVRVKATGDADWTAVGFTGNALNTNSIIHTYNKSTGTLIIKATEGTAEIKITAHDGSGVNAKVTITVTKVALSSLNVAKSSTTLYVGESEEIAVTYDPVNTTTKGYTTGSYTYVTIGNTNDVITLTGKAATSEVTERVTLTSKDAGAKTATIDVTVKPLPSVTFTDIVHSKTDLTVPGDDGDCYTAGTGVMKSTATAGVVSHTKHTPSRAADVDAAEGKNDCEQQHLHLVGWIRSDYDKVEEYLAGTGSKPTIAQITSAGTDGDSKNYYFAAGASINVETYNGFTFYAVWAKVE